MQQVEKVILKNGICLLLDPVEFFNTASIGFWVKAGSKIEEPSYNGYCHLIEHMLFKGTHKRSYLDIAREIDMVGGMMNAFTSREYTCYYVHVVSKHSSLALDILQDMFNYSVFDNTELEKEKNVVIEEINMYEDSPEELVHDMFLQNVWKDHPTGRPIIGTLPIIREIKRDTIFPFYQEHYTAPNLIISISGNMDKASIINQLESLYFPQHHPVKIPEYPETLYYETAYRVKPLEQVHFCLGFPGISYLDPLRYSSYLLSIILGSGSSTSLLFEEIREKRGLCYNIYTFNSSFKSCGIFGIYSSTSPKQFPELISILLELIQDIKNKGITNEMLECAKEQAKGSILFSRENLESRMQRIAKQELLYSRYFSFEEVMEQIDNTTVDDIHHAIRIVFGDSRFSFYSLGPKQHAKTVEKLSPNILK